MFWEKELSRLAERRLHLAADCARDRERVAAAATALAGKLAWLNAAQSFCTRYQPLILAGLPLAGLVLGRRLPRLARWSALAAPLWRVGRGLMRLWRTAGRHGSR